MTEVKVKLTNQEDNMVKRIRKEFGEKSKEKAIKKAIKFTYRKLFYVEETK